VPHRCTYDYAVVRVVPHVERGEFVNVGVIVCCATEGFLKALIEMNARRVMALDAALDLEPLRAALDAIPAICAGGEAGGPIGRLSTRERFDWLVAPRSTSIQMSPVHTGRCDDLDLALRRLMDKMVRQP
jgi:hypothetical protein